MPWELARSPETPDSPSTLETVDDAIVTAAQRGPTATTSTTRKPLRWMRGAVHRADGTLVPESQRLWNGDRFAPIAVDQERLRPMPAVEHELAGTWLFGGHFMPSFGHFLVETLTTLWPDVGGVDGLLFQHGFRTQRVRGPSRDVPLEPWHEDLFALAGFAGQRKHEVLRQPLRVERLLVPSRPVVLKSWVQPEATHVWQRIGETVAARGPDRHVFLSRAGFNRAARAERPGEFFDRSSQEHDDALDVAMRDAGLRVVEPQTLSIAEQVRLVRGADALVAASGSALHLSALARPEVRVVELGDLRTRDQPLPAQLAIDAAYGRTTAYLPQDEPAETGRAVAALLEDV